MSCSTQAVPALSERFPTFKRFALASLQEIYTPQRLEDAQRFEANTLESGILINNGHGELTFRPLPRLAQASPAFGVVLSDVDGDGALDLYLTQNFFSPQPETGRMDGGLSLLLKGNGDGSFEPIWPDRSGLIVPGDAKGLSAVDLNGDGWIDFVVAVNQGRVRAFENPGHEPNRVLKVRLQGRAGNLAAVGARVTAYLDDGSARTAEVYAGGSYLSQSSSSLIFGLGRSLRAERLAVRWPDGRTTETPISSDGDALTLSQPTGGQDSSLAAGLAEENTDAREP